MTLLSACLALTALAAPAKIQSHSTTIALESSKSSMLIMIPAKVNGQGPFLFVVDTGNAGEVIVTPSLSEKLGLVAGEKIKDVYNVGLDTAATKSSVSSLEIGDIRLGKTTVAISGAMTQIAKQLNKPIEGNLGYEFLKHYSVTLDFKKQELTLTSGATDLGGEAFDVEKAMKLITLGVQINGKPYTFALDSGASFTCISNEVVAELGLHEGPKFPMNNSDKEFGAMTKMSTFAVAGKEMKDFPAVSAGFLKALSAKTKCKIDGIIGKNFWSQFTMTIDYPHRKVRFE